MDNKDFAQEYFAWYDEQDKNCTYMAEEDIIKLLDSHEQTAALNFFVWAEDNHYRNGKIINKDGHFWFKQYTNPVDRIYLTKEQLFQLYKNEKK